jgi:hypothetical protein
MLIGLLHSRNGALRDLSADKAVSCGYYWQRQVPKENNPCPKGERIVPLVVEASRKPLDQV